MVVTRHSAQVEEETITANPLLDKGEENHVVEEEQTVPKRKGKRMKTIASKKKK